MSDLRKLAAAVVGRAALQEWFGPAQLSAVDAVLVQKMAGADRELFRVAATFDTGKTLNVYEALGGTYAPQAKE